MGVRERSQLEMSLSATGISQAFITSYVAGATLLTKISQSSNKVPMGLWK